MKFFICNNFLLITFILAVVNISSNGNNFTAKLTIVATANIVTAVKYRIAGNFRGVKFSDNHYCELFRK